MRGLRIRTDLSATELRALARSDTRRHAAPLLYVIAHVLDGISRADAARLCGMDRQALRDAVVRYNVESASWITATNAFSVVFRGSRNGGKYGPWRSFGVRSCSAPRRVSSERSQ